MPTVGRRLIDAEAANGRADAAAADVTDRDCGARPDTPRARRRPVQRDAHLRRQDAPLDRPPCKSHGDGQEHARTRSRAVARLPVPGALVRYLMYHCGAAPALEHIANGMSPTPGRVGTGIHVLGSLTEFLIE